MTAKVIEFAPRARGEHRLFAGEERGKLLRFQSKGMRAWVRFMAESHRRHAESPPRPSENATVEREQAHVERQETRDTPPAGYSTTLISPLYLLTGPAAFMDGAWLVGLCLSAVGLGGTLQLANERNLLRSKRAATVALWSFGVGMLLLVAIVSRRFLES